LTPGSGRDIDLLRGVGGTVEVAGRCARKGRDEGKKMFFFEFA